MIVDDSPVICHTLQKMLVRQGAREESVDTFQDAEKAIACFQEGPRDVVFMDIDMPGMDGEQAANVMLRANPETKVVVVTGLDKDDNRVRGLVSVGAFKVLNKPVHSDALAELLQLIETEEAGGGRIQ